MAASSLPILTLTAIASGAVTAHRFCGPDGATATAAGNAIGVFDTDAADGQAVTVNALGTTIVEAGGAIGPGGEIEVGAAGKAVAKNAGVTTGRLAPGEEALADGDLVEAILIPN